MDADFSRDYLSAEKRHWWFSARREILKAVVKSLLRQRGQKKFGSALEIGCFSGRNMLALRDLSEHWVGLEPDPNAAAEAQRRLSDAEIVTGSFPESAPGGKFDAIFALDVLEHIKDDVGALTKIKEMLTPGGVLLITVPAYQWLWSAQDTANHHFRRYTRPRLFTDLTAAGLTVEFDTYFNTILFPPAMFSRLALKLKKDTSDEKFWKIPPAWINAVLHFLFSLEKYLVPYVSLPWGLSVMAVAKNREKM
ncbi:MAG: hypothetical protein HW383_353 [Candidatus Magasanikbacteria bacterium]|nr:hypothetical protein [Candidatus Magasanikbacteria bacterium]